MCLEIVSYITRLVKLMIYSDMKQYLLFAVSCVHEWTAAYTILTCVSVLCFLCRFLTRNISPSVTLVNHIGWLSCTFQFSVPSRVSLESDRRKKFDWNSEKLPESEKRKSELCQFSYRKPNIPNILAYVPVLGRGSILLSKKYINLMT
jgi:hypothetical protein